MVDDPVPQVRRVAAHPARHLGHLRDRGDRASPFRPWRVGWRRRLQKSHRVARNHRKTLRGERIPRLRVAVRRSGAGHESAHLDQSVDSERVQRVGPLPEGAESDDRLPSEAVHREAVVSVDRSNSSADGAPERVPKPERVRTQRAQELQREPVKDSRPGMLVASMVVQCLVPLWQPASRRVAARSVPELQGHALGGLARARSPDSPDGSAPPDALQPESGAGSVVRRDSPARLAAYSRPGPVLEPQGGGAG